MCMYVNHDYPTISRYPRFQAHSNSHCWLAMTFPIRWPFQLPKMELPTM